MRILLLTTLLFLAACDTQQQSYPPKSAAEIAQLVGIADAAIGVAQKVYAGAPAADVLEATSAMRAALDAARDQTDEILRQVANVDHLAERTKDPMGVSTCIGSQRTNLGDIEHMSPQALSAWSIDVGKCAAFAFVYFKTAPAGDRSTLALPLHIIDPIMLVAGARSGLKRGALMHYLEANESIIAKLAPECGEKGGSASDAGQVSHRCAAYEVALAVRPKLQPLAGQAQTR